MRNIPIFILLLFSISWAQHGQRQYTEVPDYSGGLNIQSDSANLSLNEALTLENLTLNRYGSLQKRHGYKYWNSDTLGLTSQRVLSDIHYLFSETGDDRLYLATKDTTPAMYGFIFESSFNDTSSYLEWQNSKIGYSEGTITVNAGSDTVYGHDTWWLLGVKRHDQFYADSVGININSMINDTCFLLASNWTGDSLADTSYIIQRTMYEVDTHLSSWNNNFYAANRKVSPFYYDGDNCLWLHCVDSGTVSGYTPDASTVLDTIVPVYISFSIMGGDTYYGTLFRVAGYLDCIPLCDSIESLLDDNYNITIIFHEWQSTNLRTFDIVGRPAGCYLQIDGETEYMEYTYIDSFTQIVNYMGAADSTKISDTTKTWSSNRFVSYYILNGKEPDRVHRILSNSYNKIDILRGDVSSDTLFENGDRYYIFEAIPRQLFNNVPDSVMSPFFKQIVFHKNILFAYGYILDDGDSTETGFVFHSDIGLPKKWTSYEGFDLSLNVNEPITSMFKLHDDLCISTDSKIYKLMGWPFAIGDGALVEVTSNFGIDSYRSVVARDRNHAYVGHRDGFYRFDGTFTEKISGLIDALIDKYYTGNIVTGYYDENIYFSFPDTNKTLVCYEPKMAFTELDFGMEIMNNQSAVVDSNYFLFYNRTIDRERIYKYPDGAYVDSLGPTQDSSIAFKYKTGWLNFKSIRWEKMFERFYCDIVKGTDTLTFRFRTDYDSTVVYTKLIFLEACAGCGNRAYRDFLLPHTLKGRNMQVEIEGDSKTHQAIGPWGVKWYPSSDQ